MLGATAVALVVRYCHKRVRDEDPIYESPDIYELPPLPPSRVTPTAEYESLAVKSSPECASAGISSAYATIEATHGDAALNCNTVSLSDPAVHVNIYKVGNKSMEAETTFSTQLQQYIPMQENDAYGL